MSFFFFYFSFSSYCSFASKLCTACDWFELEAGYIRSLDTSLLQNRFPAVICPLNLQDFYHSVWTRLAYACLEADGSTDRSTIVEFQVRVVRDSHFVLEVPWTPYNRGLISVINRCCRWESEERGRKGRVRVSGAYVLC